MVKTFIKKPDKIRAIQWSGDNYYEICNFIGYRPKFLHGNLGSYIVIRTPKGDNNVFTGDWIICGVNGEFYPCLPDIFEQTYEEV